MSLAGQEAIGEEVHDTHDQFFRVERGSGEVWIDGIRSSIESGDAIIVPAGARHNLINNGDTPLQLYTIYAPPQHRDGVVSVTKAEAEPCKSIMTDRTRNRPNNSIGHS